MMIYIYTLECPIKHTIIYVGKTINLKNRYKQHCKPSSSNGRRIRNYLKYLRKNQLKPIIEVIDNTDEEDWSWLEKYWISQMKSWGFNLLNWTDGGEKQYHHHHTEQSKNKISIAQKGRKLNKEWCENISRGKSGVTFSEKHLHNLSISHKGISNPNIYKSVYKLDENLNILDKYDSITDALKNLNVSTDIGSISRACKGKIKSTLGFNWCYVEDYDKLDIKRFQRNNHRKVLKIDIKSEKIIGTYDSIKNASLDISCDPSAISHICTNKRGSIKGFIFIFEKDYSEDLVKSIKKTINLSYILEKIDLKTDKVIDIYSSIKEATELTNIKHISSVCSDKRKQAGGYYWKKVY
jgi:group I intron endonuclease